MLEHVYRINILLQHTNAHTQISDAHVRVCDLHVRGNACVPFRIILLRSSFKDHFEFRIRNT